MKADYPLSSIVTDQHPENELDTAIQKRLSRLDSHRFRIWYQKRVQQKNIQKGMAHRNGPDSIPDPELHTPSKLLQCHRKQYYRMHNAPTESTTPRGLFWFGSRFETDLVVPFLQNLIGDDLYVQNSIWVEYTVQRGGNDLQFRGKTDPVIVDDRGVPHLLIEIKTTDSMELIDEPRPHHRAQVHAYLYGLTQQCERDLRDAILIYVQRDNFDLETFHVEFDPEFWRERILTWASENTQYRIDEQLPPGEPEFDWECGYCAFRSRCGRTNGPHSDTDPAGLLPLTDTYPRVRVEAYLRAYEGAKLTPTLSDRYPELAEEYGTHNWHCTACGSTHAVEGIEWDGNVDRPPFCPRCGENGVSATLAGPSPEIQARAIRDAETE